MAGRPQESSRTGPTYRLAEFLNDNWDKMVGRTNKDVAAELNYRAANMISMWRTGNTRISLEKLPDIARLMKTDIAALIPLYFEQYWGEREDADAIYKMVSERMITDAEVPLMDVVRKARKKSKVGFDLETLQAVSRVLSDPEAVKAVLALPTKP